MNWKHLTAAAALAALAGAASPAAAQYAEGVAAVVNDQVISTYDVRQRANLLLVSAGIQSTPEMQQRAQAQALRDLIDERLQIYETRRTYEIVITPDEINRRLGDIASQNNTDIPGLTRQLANDGVSISTLRAQIEADLAWSRLISGLYGSRLRISQADITETQQRIAAAATRPQYQISEIFLPAETPQEFDDMEQGAMRLLQEMAERGAPFPLVARQFSQAPSAAAGGDIGWIASTELAPELQPIAERLEPGQVSLPVRTPSGIYIIAMRDRRAGADPGAATQIALRQITAPAARRNALERAQRRINGCDNLDGAVSGIEDALVIDLGQTSEAELSPVIRERISGVSAGAATPVAVDGEQASFFVVCARQTGGAGLPSREEIEGRLREQELSMLSERYLRNLRREATIITRQ